MLFVGGGIPGACWICSYKKRESLTCILTTGYVTTSRVAVVGVTKLHVLGHARPVQGGSVLTLAYLRIFWVWTYLALAQDWLPIRSTFWLYSTVVLVT